MSDSEMTPVKKVNRVSTRDLVLGTVFVTSTIALGMGIGNIIRIRQLSGAVGHLIDAGNTTLDLIT